LGRVSRSVRAVRYALAGVVLAASAVVGLAPGDSARAAAVEDPSDIVLVLDFSGSILNDETVRGAFADALDRIAARVEETADTLTAGDATVSIVRFATRAGDVPGCTELALRENPGAVTSLAGCLREIATAYRGGVSPALLDEIGDDTN
jgi:hypothetical protein